MSLPVLASNVSIHAPVRGATSIVIVFINVKNVSIHAPVRGATCQYSKVDTTEDVSIHAPVRGATPFLIIHNM